MLPSSSVSGKILIREIWPSARKSGKKINDFLKSKLGKDYAIINISKPKNDISFKIWPKPSLFKPWLCPTLMKATSPIPQVHNSTCDSLRFWGQFPPPQHTPTHTHTLYLWASLTLKPAPTPVYSDSPGHQCSGSPGRPPCHRTRGPPHPQLLITGKYYKQVIMRMYVIDSYTSTYVLV